MIRRSWAFVVSAQEPLSEAEARPALVDGGEHVQEIARRASEAVQACDQKHVSRPSRRITLASSERGAAPSHLARTAYAALSMKYLHRSPIASLP
jgi:hypothetical protein